MTDSVQELCKLHEGALTIRVSDGIERIDQETQDIEAGRRFFTQSYLTAGMQELVREGFKRLSGSAGGRPVFRLRQAMGGGKTHLLKTMSFLANHPPLRAEFFPEATSRYTFKGAKVAFFTGRDQPNDYFWGRLAAQLGYENFFEDGTKAPGENHWNALFDKVDSPILILLDEMPPYFAYYATQRLGVGTIADVVGRAFANLLSAAIGRKDVCVIVSDLEASHELGSDIIKKELDNAHKELGRVEFTITPVDLTGDETYAILKKRLFAELPPQSKIDHIADTYGKALATGQKSKLIESAKTPEQFVREIGETYPFHPQMKNLFALFKENKEFQQTRGLMELASRLLASVWNRPPGDVFLIGPQHFDLSIEDVREKVLSISRLEQAATRDIYSSDGSAHAQVIDADRGSNHATQIANLLLISSLSTAVNPVKGLRQPEIMECLIGPMVDLSFYQDSLADLQKASWYLHKSEEGRLYFDRLENMTKMLSELAEKAPEPKVRELVIDALKKSYEPKRKAAYSKVVPLPNLDEIQTEVQHGRVLVVIEPNSKLPPEELAKLFSILVRKNNLLVLTGEKTFEMDRLWGAARQVYAAGQARAQRRIEPSNPQWKEFEELEGKYAQHFNGVMKTIFDRLLVPTQRTGQESRLESRPLEQMADTNDGESRVEVTLTKDPQKLFLDWSAPSDFSSVRGRVERLFAKDDMSWTDIKDKAQTDCNMYLLPPGDLDKIKTRAVNEGKWEDLGNGWVTKRPKPKEATVAVLVKQDMNDNGETLLQIDVLNSDPDTTAVYYAEDSEVTERSQRLTSNRLTTKAIRIAFKAIDNSGRTTSGQPVIWKNKLKVQHEVSEPVNGQREISIRVLPSAEAIRYTLNGVNPRDGRNYEDAFEVGPDGGTLLIFASSGGVEAEQRFEIPPVGTDSSASLSPPLNRPVRFPKKLITLNRRDQVFQSLAVAQAKGAVFNSVMVEFSDGAAQGEVNFVGTELTADQLLALANSLSDRFSPQASVTCKISSAYFSSGQDLIDFSKAAEVDIGNQWESAE